MMTLNNWYFPEVGRCRWGHKGQQCVFTGGIYKQHVGIARYDEFTLSYRHIELHRIYRSYYL